MDKKTIIGLVLMVAVFVGFSFYESKQAAKYEEWKKGQIEVQKALADKQAEERAAEERVLREADSLERSGENEYLYNRIRRDSVAQDASRMRRDSATVAHRADSVLWRRMVRERIDSLRRANSLRLESE